MNKKEFINCITEKLKDGNARKPVSAGKHKIYVRAEDGDEVFFTVKEQGKTVAYNMDDVAVFLDATLEVIREALLHGEPISINGYGTIFNHYRAERRIRKNKMFAEDCEHVNEDNTFTVPRKCVPKVKFGNILRLAATAYDLSLKDYDNMSEYLYPGDPSYDDYDDDDEVEGK